MSGLGGRIAAARIKAGFTSQSQLATEIGVSQQTVNRWERNISTPRASDLERLAAVLNLELSAISAPPPVPSRRQMTLIQPLPLDSLDPENFERFCTAFLDVLYGSNAEVSRIGGPGHKQGGTDIEAVLADGTVHSYQCKRQATFGAAKVHKAVADHSRIAALKVLLLSGTASPQARSAVRNHEGWEIWDREDVTRRFRIELSMADQKRLVDVFFAGQRQALLGELEPSVWRQADDFFAPFMHSAKGFSHLWDLVGRQDEVEQLEAFSNTDEGEPVLLLIGSGGSGKTRILKALADKLVQSSESRRIYFLSKDSLLTTRSLEELGKEPLLLVCDDAHERTDLGILFDHVANPLNEARLIVGMRGYGLAHLRQHAKSIPLDQLRQVHLPKLSEADSRALAEQALAKYGGDSGLADTLAQFTRDCPLATVIGAKILAKKPMRADFLTSEDEFRSELMRALTDSVVFDLGLGLEPRAIKKVLTTIALVQPMEEGNAALIDGLVKFTKLSVGEVAEILRRLREAGVLFARGSRSRIAPDLLADFLIEAECLPAVGRSSFAEEVFDVMPASYAQNILLNLGRLDWRKSNGDTRNSTALDQLWARLTYPEYSYESTHLRAAATVAIFQPTQALAFVERMIGEGHLDELIARIAANAAFDPLHVTDACELLWKLGRDDRTATNQKPGHGVRLLAELATPGPGKSLKHVEAVVSFAIRLTKSDENFGYANSPYKVLQSALATEGSTTAQRRDQLIMSPYQVSVEAMSALRETIVKRCIELLYHPDPAIGSGAAVTLRFAVRFPMGLFGATVPDDVRAAWEVEFCKTLQLIDDALDVRVPSAAVLTDIASAVGWHANYFDGSTTPLAKSIVARLDAGIEVRTIRMLMDGWGHLTRSMRVDGTMPERDQAVRELIKELSDMFPKSADLADFLENCLTEISKAGKDASSASYLILLDLIRNETNFSRELVRRFVGRPSALDNVALFAVAHLLTADISVAQSFVQETLRSNDIRRLRVLAEAYARYDASLHGYTAADRAALDLIVRSSDGGLARSGARMLRQIASADSVLAVELALKVNTIDSPGVADELFSWVGQESTMPLENLRAEQVETLLKGLELHDALDGHWVQEFLRKVILTYPKEGLEFFQRRIALADGRDWSYRPVPSGPWRHLSLGLMEREDSLVLLASIFDWILKEFENEVSRIHFGELLEALAAPYDDRFLSALETWGFGRSHKHLDVILAVLRESNQEFAFRNKPLVFRLLAWAESLGEDALKNASSTVYVTAISGMRSGLVGKPFPQDQWLLHEANQTLSEMDRSNPGYSLYQDIAAYAKDAISRQQALGTSILEESDDD